MSFKILFACGGTAGHINPALAVAGLLRERHSDCQILFAGNPRGMESRLIPAAGYDFAPIEVLGFQRRLSLHNIANNIQAARYLLTASAKAKRIIRDFAPDVCMGTGGYVSGPVVRMAAKMRIPTLTHEQNAFPGVTTKLLCKYVNKVLLAVPEAQNLLPRADAVVTGNPIRGEVLTANRRQSREKLGVGDKICLLSFGGSLGAKRVNEAIADVMAEHSATGKLHHIHATGQYGVQTFPALLKEKGVALAGNKNIDLRTYIDDMPDCLAAADLIICRAGAISISELQAVGRASILIPSPNVAGNHQYHNARLLADKNAALLIEEKHLASGALTQAVGQLTSNPALLQILAQNAGAMSLPNATRRICEEIEQLLEPVP